MAVPKGNLFKMHLPRFILRYFISAKDENLRGSWESGKRIAGTDNVRYIGNGRQPVAIKKVTPHEALKEHISFYYEIRWRKIRTPKMLSKDKENLLIKYEAIGIKHGGETVWSKTLVNFRHDSDKKGDNIEFLTRVIEYALRENWTDLHPANILFADGYLYLIDYVPGRGSHEIGSFGLRTICEGEKDNLKRENFDELLEKALDTFPRGEVSYSGLEYLRG